MAVERRPNSTASSMAASPPSWSTTPPRSQLRPRGASRRWRRNTSSIRRSWCWARTSPPKRKARPP